MKSAVTKSIVIRINLVFLAFFLIIYVGLLLQPPAWYHQDVATPAVQCTSGKCHGEKMAHVEALMVKKTVRKKRAAPKGDVPAIFKRLQQGEVNIGLVNVGDDGSSLDWQSIGNATAIEFERVSDNFEWKDLFPEWIDEEEENEGTSCPEIPMPDFSLYEEVDVVVARLPCRRPEEGWSRDVFRLQVHLIVANMAVRRGRRDGNGKVRVVVESECRPMMEILRCDDLVAREGRWWMFEVEGVRLEEMVALPVGSCKLALPLWDEGMLSCNNEHAQ